VRLHICRALRADRDNAKSAPNDKSSHDRAPLVNRTSRKYGVLGHQTGRFSLRACSLTSFPSGDHPSLLSFGKVSESVLNPLWSKPSSVFGLLIVASTVRCRLAAFVGPRCFRTKQRLRIADRGIDSSVSPGSLRYRGEICDVRGTISYPLNRIVHTHISLPCGGSNPFHFCFAS
jgi:hypothetical protein